MQRIIGSILVSCLFTFQTFAQEITPYNSGVAKPYRSALGVQINSINNIGVRPGLGLGLTYKKFITARNAFEIYVNSGDGNIVGTTFLLQRHFLLFNNSGLGWYVGAGLKQYIYEYYLFVPDSPFERKMKIGGSLGLVGNAGLEYRFKSTPLVISVDVRPEFINLQYTNKLYVGNEPNYFGAAWPVNTSFSIRYIIRK